MILDNITNAKRYHDISDGISTALRFLADTDLSKLELGRVDIDGDNVFAIVQEYDTKPLDQGVWESHKKYIDVQFVANGRERMGFTDASGLTVRTPYDDTKDCELFDGEGDMLRVDAGWFIVFFAEEPHMPCMAIDAPEHVRKVVVKVRVMA